MPKNDRFVVCLFVFLRGCPLELLVEIGKRVMDKGGVCLIPLQSGALSDKH